MREDYSVVNYTVGKMVVFVTEFLIFLKTNK